MEDIITYFETIPSSHRSLILVGGLTFFWLLEGGIPLFKFKYKKMETCGSESVFYADHDYYKFRLGVFIVMDVRLGKRK